MNKIFVAWNGLFTVSRAGAPECLLVILLIKAIRDGFVAATMTLERFHQSAAFDEAIIGLNPLGWASLLPVTWVLSLVFNQFVGMVVLATCSLWLFKIFIPYSAVLGVASFGLLTSLSMSRGFSYLHETLPAVACLMVFTLFYVVRVREISLALSNYTFWSAPIYPRWVTVMIVLYAGLYYSFAGLSKLILGGSHAFSGIGLQMLLSRTTEGIAFFSAPIVDSRAFASMAMTMTVIVELFAVFAFFSRYLRTIWCVILSFMHIMILMTMGIPFKVNIVVLVWIGFVSPRLIERFAMKLGHWGIHQEIVISKFGSMKRWLFQRIYAIDVFCVLKIAEYSGDEVAGQVPSLGSK